MPGRTLALAMHAGMAALSVIAVAALAPAAYAIVISPANFTVQTHTAGFTTPTCVAFLPDGRLLVGEKRGRIYVVQNGVKKGSPALSIESEVLDDNDRGMLGIAVDPNFASNRLIYVLYTVDSDGGNDSNLYGFGRLTRYELDANDTVIDASRTVLIGATWTDGVIEGSPSHSIGALRWGQDGSLLVSCGDGADFNSMDPGGHYPQCFTAGRTDSYENIGAFRAQSLTSLAGKVLRINPVDGTGYPSNPYWDGNPLSKRSRIWVYGLRNPFRIQVRPNTGNANPTAGDPGTLYIGDVGWNTWEELDVATTGGKNFGWPCWEGRFTQPEYQAATPAHNGCNSVGTADNPTSPTLPPMAWHHNNPNVSTPPGFIGNASVSGVFYTGTQYPGPYRNAMFIGDYGAGWIKVATFDGNDQFVGLQDFATEVSAPVDFATDPISGDVFFVGIATNEVLRIRYTGATGNAAPVVVVSATPEVGQAPLAVQFSSSGTFDPDGDALALGWDFGDGTGSTLANPSHTYTQPGTFVARLTADDNKGGISSNSVVISTTGASGFPSTSVLDNFNRADGPIGGSWAGTTTGLFVSGQQLTQSSTDAAPVWNGASFGPTQEAFVTLNAITAGGSEHDLMLKVQGTSWSNGHIEVRYDASPGSVTISTYAPTQGWVTRGGPFTLALAAGDRLGARAYPNGAVEVYRNATLIGSASTTGWPFASSGGRIGLTLVNATQSRLDSFGGGDAVLDPNTPPVATLLTPANGSFFYTGQSIALTGSASDGQDAPAALTARWEVDVHHNNHVHPNAHQYTGLSATLIGENHDDGTGVFYRIRFIVTDTGGKSDTSSVDIFPEVDLSPSAIAVVPDPPSSSATSQATFRLRNTGRMPAPISRWALVVDGATAAQGDTVVPAQDSVTIVRTLAALGGGNHVLRVKADTLGTVVETNETNNATARTVTPGDIDPPLFVAGPSATPATTTAQVTWTSNESARGAVRYGLTTGLGDSVTTAPAINGSATLTGLTRNTPYFYRVAITDGANLTTVSSQGTFTTLANRAPVASASGNPTSGAPPLTVQFSSAGSTDPDGDALSYVWTFGDGGTATTANPSHVYAGAGAYTATLQLSDGFGGTDSKTVAINVVVPTGFPSLPVLDNFNRANAALAAPWAGQLSGMSVLSNRLVPTSNGWRTVIWDGGVFGPDQEAYVTLGAISAGSQEHDVLLKYQSTSTSAPHIEIRYDATVGRVYVGTLASGWVTHLTIVQTLAAGDRLGARALANGTVEVYRNTTKIGTATITSWPYYTLGGRLGLTVAQATASALDDFGGGTIVTGPDVTPPQFTAGPSAAPQSQSATVSWTTNETTTGVVRYGLTAALGDSVTSAAATSHVDAISNLTRGTTYFYRVLARDAAGLTTLSAQSTFTTIANRAPIANATGTPTTGVAPLTVQLSSAGSSDPDGDPIQTSWAFGDGGTSTAANPSHPYAATGTYNAILTVTDGLGGTGRDTVVVVVTPPGNNAPIANANGTPTTGVAPLTVQLSSAGSSDPDGDPIQTAWAFGDGGTSTAANPSHVYAAGTFNAILTVTDGRGGTGRDTVVVVATPPPNNAPIANATGTPTTGTAPLTVQLSSAGSSDPDGDPIQTAWAFGDGGTSTAANPSHVYAAGTFNAILTVTDGRGGTGRDTVVVVATPPASGFPTTAVLDNFNRANGAPGASWADQVTRVGISNNALALTQSDATVVWSPTVFGATQEAYVTLIAVAGVAERDLMLKVQGLSWSGGHIEVRYSPGSITVATYAPSQGWVTRGGPYAVTLVAGDRLGARADAAGQVQVYRNATLIGTASVSAWPFSASGGRLGLTLAGGVASAVDDFGGGTVPGTTPASPAVALPAPTGERDAIPSGVVWLSPARPNPSSESVGFTLSLPEAASVHWSVVDLQGRAVWNESRGLPAGTTSLTWTGRAGGRRAPAGIYLAVVDVGGRRVTRRFVRVE